MGEPVAAAVGLAQPASHVGPRAMSVAAVEVEETADCTAREWMTYHVEEAGLKEGFEVEVASLAAMKAGNLFVAWATAAVVIAMDSALLRMPAEVAAVVAQGCGEAASAAAVAVERSTLAGRTLVQERQLQAERIRSAVAVAAIDLEVTS